MDDNFGRSFDLNSVFNERAGPRQANWFWKQRSPRSSLISHGFSTPEYAQATNLYPHLAKRQETDYKYRPSNATVIPVVHMMSNSNRSDSQGGTTPITTPWYSGGVTSGWPPSSQSSEMSSPVSTIRSGYSMNSISGFPGGAGNTDTRSPTTSTASSKTDTEAEVDALTNLLMQSMESKQGNSLKKAGKEIPVKSLSSSSSNPSSLTGTTNQGSTSSKTMVRSLATNANTQDVECFRCRRRLKPNESGGMGGIRVGALNTHFHTSCFSCYRCSTPLHQDAFFHAHKRLLCPRCVTDALESCITCDRPITERVIRALGKPYHPKCFVCTVCNQRLDGKPFTVDVHNRIHCLDDFHKRYAPRCSACGHPITPENGKQETKRVVANDKNYHLDCFGMRGVI